MTEQSRLYLMLHERGDYGDLTNGHHPAEAVENHYDFMDSWCSPPENSSIHEEFQVTLYAVPDALEDLVRERFEVLDGDEFADEIRLFLAAYPSLGAVTVDVVYTADGAKASVVHQQADLFGRNGEG